MNRYRDRTLNELPEFEGLNPSVENFARILGDILIVTTPNITPWRSRSGRTTTPAPLTGARWAGVLA